MSALFILIGISLLVASGFLIAFLWSARSGQYDDDYTPSVRILFEDAPKNLNSTKEKSPLNKNQKHQVKRNQN